MYMHEDLRLQQVKALPHKRRSEQRARKEHNRAKILFRHPPIRDFPDDQRLGERHACRNDKARAQERDFVFEIEQITRQP
jgi:hypothetical protein